MIVEMPFIQRYIGRTKNLCEVRPLAAWDRERVLLPDHPLSSFDEGSHFGDGIHTLYRDNSHWAYYGTSVTGKLDYRRVDASAADRALLRLAGLVDMTRFFDEGRIETRISGTPDSPPDAKWTDLSQRDRNVARVLAWVSDNVITIDGHLAVRVGEPSLRVRVSPPNSKGIHQLVVQRDDLLPVCAIHEEGLHFGIEDIDEIRAVTTHAVASSSLLDRCHYIHDDTVLASMKMAVPACQSMYERTLLSLVRYATSCRLTGQKSKNHGETLSELKRLLTSDDQERDDHDLDRMINGLARLQLNIGVAASILTDITIARWDDRPIGNIADGRNRPSSPVIR